MLVIAIGNPLRNDDGAAHYALRLLKAWPRIEARAVQQLTPELAETIAPYDTVIFMDADISTGELSIEPVEPATSASGLTHQSCPSEVIALARALFGFSGQAYICRIPAIDMAVGKKLSPGTKKFAGQAARLILRFSNCAYDALTRTNQKDSSKSREDSVTARSALAGWRIERCPPLP